MEPTLLLDLDGTLVDTVPDLLASLNRLMASHGLPALSATEVVPMIGDGAAVLVRRAMAARGQDATPTDQQTLLADYTANVADGSRLFPGVEPTLRAMAADGWRLAVCTNKPVLASRELLATLGVLDLFAAVGGGDSYRTRKPDPKHLLSTLADAGGRADAAVMVGDHHNDVQAALGAGVPCIFAAWGYGAAPAEVAATAATFPEVARLARELLGRG
jgi:phosphoglycolate phosphatase